MGVDLSKTLAITLFEIHTDHTSLSHLLHDGESVDGRGRAQRVDSRVPLGVGLRVEDVGFQDSNQRAKTEKYSNIIC